VIDCDTHVIEPYDLWTSRVSVEKWGDKVPRVRWDENAKEDAWFFGDARISAAAGPAAAGWAEFPPKHAPRLEDVDPATWDAKLRLQRMDNDGIYAQVLYPNVAGFGSGRFLSVKEPQLMLELVQAYNDFLTDYASAAPGRYLPVMALPFWDIDESIAEMKRAKENGHRGIVFGSEPEAWGAPMLTDRHWEPIWSAAEEMGLPVNFHIASGDVSAFGRGDPINGMHANFASDSVFYTLASSRAIARVIFSGICHRHPNLNFVVVESGVGWLPFALTTMNWIWQNCGVSQEHPEFEMLPNEYFRRQIYGCFWFETDTLQTAVEQIGSDNFLYETDFPHPTSMSPVPGLASVAVKPKDYIDDTLKRFSEEEAVKLLHGNAARIYHLDA